MQMAEWVSMAGQTSRYMSNQIVWKILERDSEIILLILTGQHFISQVDTALPECVEGEVG